MKCVFKHQYLQIFVHKLNKYEYFQPLEVAELHVAENLNILT